MYCSDNIPLTLANCNPCADCPPTNAVALPPCIDGEPCEEVSETDCVSFIGSNLPALGVLTGDRLKTVLTKLHKVINGLLPTPVPLVNYTATATTTTPYIVRYLGLGPVYISTPGATSSNTSITVGSTTNLVAGMTLEVTAGVGAFAANTTVVTIQGTTTFVASQAPTTALSGGATVIKGTGSNHQIFTTSVIQGTPQSFKAFAGSPVVVSGTGTLV